jgi:hypothetical protein
MYLLESQYLKVFAGKELRPLPLVPFFIDKTKAKYPNLWRYFELFLFFINNKERPKPIE